MMSILYKVNVRQGHKQSMACDINYPNFPPLLEAGGERKRLDFFVFY